MEQALVTYLEAQTDLTDLVGKRIYPLRAPQDAGFPRLTYSPVSRPREHTTTEAAGLLVARYQLDVWGLDYASVRAVADVVRGNLDGYRGLMGSIFVQASLLDDERDTHEPPQHADDVGMYRVSMDFRFAYSESVPTF